jgi:ABC-type oligopeptide transport system ATPase subunit
MQRGRIEAIGIARSVFETPQRNYTRALLAAVPRLAAPIPRPVPA